MRFAIGLVSADPAFRPEEEGWRKAWLPEGPWGYLLAASLGAVIVVGLALAIGSVLARSPRIVVRSGDVTVTSVAWWLLLALLDLLGTTAAHELLHVLAHPGLGRSKASIVGFVPRQGFLYAHYEGEMSRNRYLVGLALPFLALSVAPVAAMWMAGRVNVWLALTAIFNGIGSCADVMAFILFLAQIPVRAVVRCGDGGVFWRPAS